MILERAEIEFRANTLSSSSASWYRLRCHCGINHVLLLSHYTVSYICRCSTIRVPPVPSIPLVVPFMSPCLTILMFAVRCLMRVTALIRHGCCMQRYNITTSRRRHSLPLERAEREISCQFDSTASLIRFAFTVRVDNTSSTYSSVIYSYSILFLFYFSHRITTHAAPRTSMNTLSGLKPAAIIMSLSSSLLSK
jgi:hypothetical protein